MPLQQLGPYRIGQQLGRGGMGTVYQGTNDETGHPAAIKVLNPRLAVEDGFRERFATEIETLKKLKHPNIVRLYGFGEQDGQLYYAMELVPGANLEDELQAGRRYTWRETAQLGIKLGRALKHAHDHGVIHRDLKPANLLLPADNDVKLADFGIARLFGNTRLTTDGGLIGTAEYMAPEQADGRRVTFHCDLYSLGGVLFAMLAGRPPFRGGSLPEMLQYHRFAEPPPVSRFADDVPDELQQIIARLLSKDPLARGANALMVSRQLAAMEHALTLRLPAADLPSDQEDRDGPSSTAPKQQIFSADPIPGSVTHERQSGDHDRHELEANDEFSISAATTQADPGQPTPPLDRLDPAATLASAPMRDPVTSALSPNNSLAIESLAPRLAADDRAARSVKQPFRHPAPLGDSNDEPRPQSQNVTSGVGRFTTVEEDELRRALEDRGAHRGPPWAQIVALAASLATIAGLVVYLTRPLSADSLFERIETVAADESSERLLEEEDDIRRYLKRFPDDPRRAKLASYLEEIDLLHLERRLQRLPRQLGREESLSPIQRDYLDAMSHFATSPQQTAARLRAIVEIYESLPKLSSTTTQFVELARRQLKRLEDQSARAAPAYLEVIDANLKRADDVRSMDPAASRKIWSGIVQLYAEQPWAAGRVAKARDNLRQTQ